MGATPIDDNVADGNLANRNIRLISVDYTRFNYKKNSIKNSRQRNRIKK